MGLGRDADISIEQLLAEAKAGKTLAFTELHRRYAGRVRAFAVARNAEDPDAIANEAMLKVFQGIERFSGSTSGFESWVFTIARNQIIDAYRKSRRRPLPAGVEVADEARTATSAEDVALAGAGLSGAVELLSHLTADQREVVALRLIADLSIEQVAQIVDRPVTAVKALQRRGLQRLQREIRRREVSES